MSLELSFDNEAGEEDRWILTAWKNHAHLRSKTQGYTKRFEKFQHIRATGWHIVNARGNDGGAFGIFGLRSERRESMKDGYAIYTEIIWGGGCNSGG